MPTLLPEIDVTPLNAPIVSAPHTRQIFLNETKTESGGNMGLVNKTRIFGTLVS